MLLGTHGDGKKSQACVLVIFSIQQYTLRNRTQKMRASAMSFAKEFRIIYTVAAPLVAPLKRMHTVLVLVPILLQHLLVLMIVVLRYSVFTLVQTFIHVLQNAVDVAPVAVVVV